MRHSLVLGLLACCLALASGCRPAVKAAWKLLRGGAKAVPVKPSSQVDDIGRNLRSLHGEEAVQPTSIPGTAPNTIPRTAFGSHAKIPGAANVLDKSEAVGDTLLALEVRIPVHIFSQLYREWQRNHAELQSYERQLQDPELSSDRRARLEARMETIATRQAEIERLAREWG